MSLSLYFLLMLLTHSRGDCGYLHVEVEAEVAEEDEVGVAAMSGQVEDGVSCPSRLNALHLWPIYVQRQVHLPDHVLDQQSKRSNRG